MNGKFKNKYRIPSARLINYDYRKNGAYFITICTKNRAHYFGKIENGISIPSNIGKLAEKFWMEIPIHFPFVELGDFVIMPNHMHGIIIINSEFPVETLHCNVSNVGIKSDVNNSNVQNDIKELQNIKHSVEMLHCNVSNVGIKSDVNNSNVQNDIKELQNIKHSVKMLQCNVSNVGIKSDVNNSNVQNDIKELQNIKHSVEMLHCNVYNDGIKSNDIDYKINKSNSVEQNNNHQNFIEPSETLQCNVSTKMSQISPKKGSLAIIIRSYKSVVTKYAREIDVDFGWQTRFHDHIIRHENSFHLISNYIRNNPVNWEEDKFY